MLKKFHEAGTTCIIEKKYKTAETNYTKCITRKTTIKREMTIKIIYSGGVTM